MNSLLKACGFCFISFFTGMFLDLLLDSTLPLAEGSRNFLRLRKNIVVDYFENCEQKIYAFSPYFKFSRNGSFTIINGEEIISKDFSINYPVSVQFVIEKCSDKSNPDTCEYYTTWKFDDFCALRLMPFFPAFLEAHSPPLTCPFKKGRYVIKDARIDPGLVAPFWGGASNQVLWKQRILLKEKNQLIGCLNLGFRIVDMRIRF
nr:PREDICTED: uncharacterized protein LOC109038830 [Bemisia tabaci]